MVKKIVTYTATGLLGLFVLGLIVGPQDSPVAAPTPTPEPVAAAPEPVAATAPAPAPQKRRRGEYTITRASLGCLDAADWDKVIQLRNNGDEAALDAHLMPLVFTGQCKLLDAGTSVFLSDSKVFKGRSLVRPAGQLKEYWVAYEAVQP